ncbi:hypothetical protein KKC63_03555 [Patescibacteria group bacterium]|nr:hypothetical protein [Patescibacteria group bacterium]MBU4023322.1 hypothetical protein [Patescibacteria group bacterium]MBU4078385.1 hypothetical protein [Patescibacteria group bacterium]
MLDYQVICQEILQDLEPRKREVLEKRFGLRGEDPLTLQAIGDELRITRERVRQIENDALLWLRGQKSQTLNKPIQGLFDYLESYGGLREETMLLQELGEDKFQNHILLFLNLGNDFTKFKETDDFFTLWATKEEKLNQAKKVIETLIKELEKRNDLMESQELGKKAPIKVEQSVLISYIDISKNIFQSPFGYYGLASWPEVRPKGLRDNAYLVLKKEEKPLHFRDITELIGKLPASSGGVLSESVHNELIRNENFVLIGRGIYALKEWGYEPGTVREVISEVLKSAKKPLKKDEIFKKVLKQRDVKESTVLLNLQNKKYFDKDKQGRYTIAKG